ncbi:hypothetical protein [Microvirgula aerodenitrificans]|nr:hypothetical protein [Microvirgula aerodenitrificans]
MALFFLSAEQGFRDEITGRPPPQWMTASGRLIIKTTAMAQAFAMLFFAE